MGEYVSVFWQMWLNEEIIWEVQVSSATAHKDEIGDPLQVRVPRHLYNN